MKPGTALINGTKSSRTCRANSCGFGTFSYCRTLEYMAQPPSPNRECTSLGLSPPRKRPNTVKVAVNVREKNNSSISLARTGKRTPHGVSSAQTWALVFRGVYFHPSSLRHRRATKPGEVVRRLAVQFQAKTLETAHSVASRNARRAGDARGVDPVRGPAAG